MTVTEAPSVNARLAQALIAEMKEHGIFRAVTGYPARVFTGHFQYQFTGSVCLIANRTLRAAEADGTTNGYRIVESFNTAVREAIHAITNEDPDVVTWLNAATDDEVFAMLDTIK